MRRALIPYSPITGEHVREGGMSVGALCAATLKTSDNTAANLLEPFVGGLSGLQAFVRTLEDTTMRFDRTEPDLNSNISGDLRDTTSPEAMARLLRTALETEKLTKASREQLLVWMKAATTGQKRIRAHAQKGWIVADKSGTGDNGAANDVAVIFPTQGAPIYLVVFTDGDRTNLKTHEEAIAEVAKVTLGSLP